MCVLTERLHICVIIETPTKHSWNKEKATMFTKRLVLSKCTVRLVPIQTCFVPSMQSDRLLSQNQPFANGQQTILGSDINMDGLVLVR